ncbi:hypothetical protein CJ030_MR4G022480 [Morella rubra]|uniref:Uncharacterized protein n=1 Tax=Morella rubra TaxID=262757 RepID=A0A6A1VSZ2_9ROSI|nr:hypothetical protein CJ030_MR4G022480 [Morella rubra]
MWLWRRREGDGERLLARSASEFGGGRRKGVMMIPEGKGGSGWKDLAAVFQEVVSHLGMHKSGRGGFSSSRVRNEVSFVEVAKRGTTWESFGGGGVAVKGVTEVAGGVEKKAMMHASSHETLVTDVSVSKEVAFNAKTVDARPLEGCSHMGAGLHRDPLLVSGFVDVMADTVAGDVDQLAPEVGPSLVPFEVKGHCPVAIPAPELSLRSFDSACRSGFFFSGVFSLPNLILEDSNGVLAPKQSPSFGPKHAEVAVFPQGMLFRPNLLPEGLDGVVGSSLLAFR